MEIQVLSAKAVIQKELKGITSKRKINEHITGSGDSEKPFCL